MSGINSDRELRPGTYTYCYSCKAQDRSSVPFECDSSNISDDGLPGNVTGNIVPIDCKLFGGQRIKGSSASQLKDILRPPSPVYFIDCDPVGYPPINAKKKNKNN